MSTTQMMYLMDLAECTNFLRATSILLIIATLATAVGLTIDWYTCDMETFRRRALLFSVLFVAFLGVLAAVFIPSERTVQEMIYVNYVDNNSAIYDSDKEGIRKTIENKINK